MSAQPCLGPGMNLRAAQPSKAFERLALARRIGFGATAHPPTPAPAVERELGGCAVEAAGTPPAGDPVVASGRSFPPRLVGAVSGGSPGQPLSFAKLMKDATRALEQARRDGAELAVQP